jgi:hypothetical protein
MADPLILILSSEELVYLLRALTIHPIPDFALDIFATLNNDQQSLAMAVADRGLRARQLIRRTGQFERQIIPQVEVLTHYAHPTRTLSVRLKRPPVDILYQYIRTDTTVVEYCEADIDIHQFVTLETLTDVRASIGKLFSWKDIPGKGEAAVIDESVLKPILHQPDLGKIITILQEHLPSSTARGLAQTLENPDILYEIILGPHTYTRTILVQGSAGTYIFIIHDGQLQIFPSTTEDVWRQLDLLLDNFLGESGETVKTKEREAH